MSTESISQSKLDELLSTPKRVANPNARAVMKGQHQQWNYRVVGVDDNSFTLYLRQNTNVSEDFSCGLNWSMPSGEVLTLVRYNGPSHSHRNQVERQVIEFKPHIHHATARYMDAGRKPEGFAEATDRYDTLRGALHCLVNDCNVTGIQADPDQPDLFK